jgi:hypothetical protein
MEINLKLDLQSVNFILNVLGELPSKTGAFVLLKQIEEQAKAQVPQEPTEG